MDTFPHRPLQDHDLILAAQAYKSQEGKSPSLPCKCQDMFALFRPTNVKKQNVWVLGSACVLEQNIIFNGCNKTSDV